MDTLLSNSWFVGIAGGILSGLIVTVITRYIFSRRDNREYAQKIAAVNREVVYALRPGISEGYIPDEAVLSSLINATARKYRVSRDDVFRPKQIAEELIKEIMDSSFISSDTKQTYCETLAHLVEEPEIEFDIKALQVEKSLLESDYRSRMASRMSFTLGLTAAMITMSMAFFRVIGDREPFSSPFGSILDVLLPVIMVLVATLVAMMAMLSIARVQRLRRRDEEQTNKETERGNLES